MVAREGPGTNQLGSATSEKSLQFKKTGKTSTLRKPPFSVTSSSPPDEALCSRKIYTFPTQMSFPDQLLEGQAELNPRPLLRAPSPSTSAGLSSLCSPPSKPYSKRGPGPRPRPWTRLPDRVRPGLPAGAAVRGDPLVGRLGETTAGRGVSLKGKKTASP